jgi:hypothetical protein
MLLVKLKIDDPVDASGPATFEPWKIIIETLGWPNFSVNFVGFIIIIII